MSKLSAVRLRKILTDSLGLREPEFRLETYGGRISGSLISPTFKGKRDDARQRVIWAALDRALGADSVKLVGMILAYTPDEWYVGTDGPKETPKSKRLVGK